ncbi:50S ribosomal protein L19 [candidate division FCPU426 bacterium]|nr:50S ribosomal protein L19 [candidate division FCPU426 bacterium]
MNIGETCINVERAYLRKKRLVRFDPGDMVKVYLKIKEGEKERIQIFEGTVIGRKGNGINESFKVRRIASGVGVERTFLVHSPLINEVKVVKRGEVARAKLYYLRGKTGKHAKIKQMRREKMLQIQAAEQKELEALQAASALEAAAQAAAKKAEEQKAEEAKAEQTTEA